MKLIIYLPMFNEEDNIRRVIASLPAQVEGIDHVEILAIDDGSQDRSAEMAEEAGALVIRHGCNRGVGQPSARQCNMRWIITRISWSGSMPMGNLIRAKSPN